MDGNIPTETPLMGRRMQGSYEKKTIFDQYLALSLNSTDARQSHGYYRRRIGDCTQAFEWYQFEWPSVTYNPDFKVTIIQRQITQKWLWGSAARYVVGLSYSTVLV